MHEDDADVLARGAAPAYDSWRRAREGTGSYRLVELALDATSELRTRGRSTNPRRRKAADQAMYAEVVNALVSALVHRELTKPKGWVRVPLSHARLGSRAHDKGKRYRSLALSRSLPWVVHYLDAIGWLTLSEGRPGCREREQSRIRASRALAQHIKAYDCRLSDFVRSSSQELLVLKGRKPAERDGRGRSLPAPWLDYMETPETERMRAEMRELNAWLADLPIDYVVKGHGVDPLGDRTMRRIFHNGSFDEGGRLFGGFWLNAPMRKPDVEGPWRGHVRIEGEPLVVLDFSTMFLRLAYTFAGVPPPSGDLYAGIEGLTADGAEYRDGAKRLISSMFFADGDLQRAPQGSRIALPPKLHVRKLVENIKRRHAPVAHLLGGDGTLGFRLFRLESDVMLETLRLCREAGLAALPVHDAVLVAERRAEQAKRVMLAAFENVTGFEGEVGEPKRPGELADEPDTVFSPDDQKQPEDEPHQWRNILATEKEGHRELATLMAKEFAADGPPALTPDGDADWV